MKEQELRDRFKGFHIEISIYPSGGMIEITGCESCHTDEGIFESALWKSHLKQNMETAIIKLEEKMEKKYGKGWKPE